MEMGEHSPSWRKPVKLPIIRCERPLSHLGARSAYGTVRWKWSSHSGGLVLSLHMLHHWTNPLVTPLTHSPDLETGATSPKISPCDLRKQYGIIGLWVAYRFMGVRRAAHGGGLQQSLHMLNHWTNPLVTPLTHSPDLETGATSPKISPCDLRKQYGIIGLWVAYRFMGVRRAAHSGGLQQSLHTLNHWTNP